jgi:hypothetical protein
VTPVAVVVLAVVAAYLLAGAVLALLTIGAPRRAFDLRTSVLLAVARTALAVSLLAVLVGSST